MQRHGMSLCSASSHTGSTLSFYGPVTFFTTLIIVGGRVEIRVCVAAIDRTLSISSYL